MGGQAGGNTTETRPPADILSGTRMRFHSRHLRSLVTQDLGALEHLCHQVVVVQETVVSGTATAFSCVHA